MNRKQRQLARSAPDWRWHRAQLYIDAKLKPRRWHEDALTRAAYRFKRRLARDNPLANVQLERDYPDMYVAYTVNDNDERMTRWLIEAGILAGESDEMLARYLSIPASVVEMYEKLFFNVRWALSENREHEGWLLSTVFGASERGGFIRGDTDQSWKAIAYWGGWDALRSYITQGEMPPHAVDYFRAAIAANKLKGQWAASNVHEINAFNAVDHLQLGVQDRRLEKEFGGQAANAIESSVHGLMESIHVEIVKQATVMSAEEPRLQEVPPASIFLDAQKVKALKAPKEGKNDDKST